MCLVLDLKIAKLLFEMVLLALLWGNSIHSQLNPNSDIRSESEKVVGVYPATNGTARRDI